jgi:hypothetical protein
MPFYTVSIFDNKRWDRLIRNAHTFDFSHTWYYHSTATSGEPILLVYEEKDDFIALPLVKKCIQGTEDYEAHAISGYAGPVSSRSFALPGQGLQERFEASLMTYLEQERIVQMNIRLHPMIHQHFKPVYAGKLQKSDDSLLIDLSLPPEMHQQHYGEEFASGVNMLRKKGYAIRPAAAICDVDIFADIYQHNMLRLNETIGHHHDKAWFRQMMRPSGFDSSLLVACRGTVIVAGVLLTFCNDIMQLHLAATHENYLQDAPLRLLLAEAAALGTSMGMQYLHLGGMVDKTDALFASKALSPDIYPGFRTWNISTANILVAQNNYDFQQELLIAV